LEPGFLRKPSNFIGLANPINGFYLISGRLNLSLLPKKKAVSTKTQSHFFEGLITLLLAKPGENC
jgi:hypothetical protein